MPQAPRRPEDTAADYRQRLIAAATAAGIGRSDPMRPMVELLAHLPLILMEVAEAAGRAATNHAGQVGAALARHAEQIAGLAARLQEQARGQGDRQASLDRQIDAAADQTAAAVRGALNDWREEVARHDRVRRDITAACAGALVATLVLAAGVVIGRCL